MVGLLEDVELVEVVVLLSLALVLDFHSFPGPRCTDESEFSTFYTANTTWHHLHEVESLWEV